MVHRCGKCGRLRALGAINDIEILKRRELLDLTFATGKKTGSSRSGMLETAMSHGAGGAQFESSIFHISPVKRYSRLYTLESLLRD